MELLTRDHSVESDARLRRARGEEKPIPPWLDFDQVHGLKAEARHKLKTIRPRTFGQAARISGITPASISLLMVYLKKSKWKADLAQAAA